MLDFFWLCGCFFLRGISFVFFIGFLMRIGGISVWWVCGGLFFFFYNFDGSWVLFPCWLYFRVGCVSVWGGCVSVFLRWVWRFLIFFLIMGIGLYGIPWLEFLFDGIFFFFHTIFVTVLVIVSGC